MKEEKIIYCADAIITHVDTGKIVIVERLGSLPGLAFPGGKQESRGEPISKTVVREVLEETGLSFKSHAVLGVYAEDGRDPRGKYISAVFIGKGRGSLKEEQGKTKIYLFTLEELEIHKARFVFDHARVFEDYLRVYKIVL